MNTPEPVKALLKSLYVLFNRDSRVTQTVGSRSQESSSLFFFNRLLQKIVNQAQPTDVQR